MAHEHLQEVVFAHPDGQAHKKACRECAFRRSNPQTLTEDDFDWMYLQRELGGFTFFCVHRDVEGYSRECACWAAIERGRQVAVPS